MDTTECERALSSIRRHVRLARTWGCRTVVVRGNRMEKPKLRACARELDERIAKEGIGPELREEIQSFVREAQKRSHCQIEQFCRSLFTLHQEAPDVVFAIEPGRAIDDLLGFDAMGWILDDLNTPSIGYWHDVGRIHLREKMGLPPQGDWLEAYSSRMIGIHLQDAADEQCEMPVGCGEVDFRLLSEYVPSGAERVIEIGPRHGRAEILASVQFLEEHGF
jgi:sugar phosphate isomerase/epimerase